jgi:hypothetical protein
MTPVAASAMRRDFGSNSPCAGCDALHDGDSRLPAAKKHSFRIREERSALAPSSTAALTAKSVDSESDSTIALNCPISHVPVAACRSVGSGQEAGQPPTEAESFSFAKSSSLPC